MGASLLLLGLAGAGGTPAWARAIAPEADDAADGPVANGPSRRWAHHQACQALVADLESRLQALQADALDPAAFARRFDAILDDLFEGAQALGWRPPDRAASIPALRARPVPRPWDSRE